MSPLHFDLLHPVFEKQGYHIALLSGDNRSAVDTGLRFVNNDACYPSIIVTGMFMEAVLSGRYDTDRLAIMMSQTGGCCRASNYVAFIRRALEQAGFSHIPVISFNANGMEKNSGFHVTLPFLYRMLEALVLGDVLMRCLYRTRPYEAVRGSADAMKERWMQRCRRYLGGKPGEMGFRGGDDLTLMSLRAQCLLHPLRVSSGQA